MADANTPSEGQFVFDSTRLDIIVGDGTPLYLGFIVAPDRTFVSFRMRREGVDDKEWPRAYK